MGIDFERPLALLALLPAAAALGRTVWAAAVRADRLTAGRLPPGGRPHRGRTAAVSPATGAARAGGASPGAARSNVAAGSRATRAGIARPSSRWWRHWRGVVAAPAAWRRLAEGLPGRTGWQVGLRAAIALALILALAGVRVVHRARDAAVIFVADVSASTAQVHAAQERFIREALRHKGPDDLAGVLVVADGAAIDVPLSRAPQFERFSAAVPGDRTDLARGLRLAGALLPEGYRRRVVLLSDGRENRDSALDEAARLRRRGIAVDVVPLAVPQGPEALVRGVESPGLARRGERVQIGVTVASTAAGPAILRLYEDRRLVEARPVALPVGEETFTFALPHVEPGFRNVWVTLEAERDTLAQNNEASTLIEVEGPPRILIAEGSPGAGDSVAAALRATGAEVEVRPGDVLPSRLTTLQRYQAVVLVDVPAAYLSRATLQALTLYVREAGRGLVVLGGENSYSMGGYGHTPLEDLLPVSMEVPQRKENPTVAVALIIEHLESDVRVNVSKEAGKGVVALLGPRDRVAVSEANLGWAVPMRLADDKPAIFKAIDAMSPGDPPSYVPFLRMAADALRQTDAKLKHIILVGDGDAQINGVGEYEEAARRIAADGITLSTLHVPTHARPEEFFLMQRLAEWGRGRYHSAIDPAAIPQVLLKEAKAAAKTSVVEERFVPAIASAAPVLRGITALPPLGGYLATTPKPQAEVVLQSPLHDPVLAQWQVGLGRVVAWTSDAQGRWTADLLRSDAFARLIGNAAGWVLPARSEARAETHVSVRGNHALLTVTLPPEVARGPGGNPGDASAADSEAAGASTPAALTATVIQPDGQVQITTLPAIAPGEFEGDIPVPQVGSYLVRLTERGGRTAASYGAAGLAVPYSPEFELAGADEALLRRVARAGGGKPIAEPGQAFARDLPSAAGYLPLAPWLLVLAALLWPVDVAARRLALTPAEAWAALAAWRRRGEGRSYQPAAVAAAQRLRERRAAAAPAPPPSTAAAGPRTQGAPSPAPDTSPPPREAPPPPPGGGDQPFTERLLEARRRARQRGPGAGPPIDEKKRR